ncbi:hypothetical protein A3I58_03290 [Candidatus Peregrinibacteria bacterium RIFCSPLOWO2_02_FULL_39_10]|nr:MAG: hypothetical protein A3I58_03290 [Candidatus Peregrinibacteria bacterium RIFCSPLOWO2_02_FULL_39_10]
MDKFNKFLKNALIFLIIFLIVNYIFQYFQGDKGKELLNSGNFIFETTDTEYSRRQVVTVSLTNNTKEPIIIPNECPNEPLTVLRYENNEWVKKTASPELDCSSSKDLTIQPEKKIKIAYDSWNNALFNNMGRFKIELTTKVNGEEKTFTTNEFTITKEGMLRQLWNGVFYRPIYNGLMFLIAKMPGNSLGWAIILLTILIRTILLVPSQKAMKAQKRMQEIQPRIEKIKEKHKGDQQKIAMETMAIWKDAKVSPFGSCLPILLQFPVLIALFYVIQRGLNPDNAFLLYANYANLNLSNIDTNFLNILELTKVNFYVLPLVIGGLQFFQMKLAMGKKNIKAGNEMAMATNMMTYVMPVMIAVFTASMPAGVGLYWGVSTIYGIVQQIVVNRGKPHTADEPTVRIIENKENNIT